MLALVQVPDALQQFEESLPLYVQLMQIAFYVGLLALMVGLPLFVWLWIRALRDLHQIRGALWHIANQLSDRNAAEGVAKPSAVRMSALGR